MRKTLTGEERKRNEKNRPENLILRTDLTPRARNV